MKDKERVKTRFLSMPMSLKCNWDHAPDLQKIISINTFFKCNNVLSSIGSQKRKRSLQAKKVVDALKKSLTMEKSPVET